MDCLGKHFPPNFGGAHRFVPRLHIGLFPIIFEAPFSCRNPRNQISPYFAFLCPPMFGLGGPGRFALTASAGIKIPFKKFRFESAREGREFFPARSTENSAPQDVKQNGLAPEATPVYLFRYFNSRQAGHLLNVFWTPSWIVESQVPGEHQKEPLI
jgi:hypothetical protein